MVRGLAGALATSRILTSTLSPGARRTLELSSTMLVDLEIKMVHGTRMLDNRARVGEFLAVNGFGSLRSDAGRPSVTVRRFVEREK